MSMLMSLRRADAATVEALRSGGQALDDFLEPPGAPPDLVELEKCWDVIGRALWGGDPAGLLKDGSPLNDEDVGYGPAVVLPPPAVARLDARLRSFGASDLRAYLSGPDFDGSGWSPYPFHRGLDPSQVDGEVESFMPYVERLRSIAREAASNGNHLIAWIW